MIVREAQLGDVSILSKLAVETYVEAFGHSFLPPDLAAHLEKNLSRERIARMIDEDTVLVAEVAGRMIGYVQFGKAHTIELIHSDDDVELRRLYVHIDFQNRGIGTQLLDVALEHPLMANADRIFLDVWEYNPGARRFYERYGFEVAGERIFHVESGAETSLDWIMVRHTGVDSEHATQIG